MQESDDAVDNQEQVVDTGVRECACVCVCVVSAEINFLASTCFFVLRKPLSFLDSVQ